MTSAADDGVPRPAARYLRRRRDPAPRPLSNRDDLVIGASLAGLLPGAWLLPEACWPRLCRLLARTPVVDRRALARNTEAIRHCLGIDPTRARAIAVELQAAVYELRLQNLRALVPGAWRPQITLTGAEHLDAALAAGRGAVLWVGHFAFNSNVTKMALAACGKPVTHMSRPEHGFSKTRLGVALLNPVRCAAEDRYLDSRVVFDRHNPAAAMRRMLLVLDENRLLSITAGAWEGNDLAEAALLGGRIRIALGAPRLAARTGAALLPVFTIRRPDGGFRVAVEPPIALRPGTDRRDTACAAAAEYLKRHEPWIAAHPDQWRGWKEWRPA